MSFPYFRWFPGDYLADTIHLGWLEDLAYRRLIDYYHLHSKPIPNDRCFIMRIVRANEPEQQAAVDTVLAEFFQLSTDGWHQKRCDSEMRYRQNLSEAGKRAVKARENKKLLSIDDRPIIDRSSNQNQNQNQTTTTPTGKWDGDKAGQWAVELIARGIAVTSMHPTLLELISEKRTLPEMLDAVTLARQRKPLPEKIPINYIASIARNPPKAQGPQWWSSDAGIEAEAKRVKVSTIGKSREQVVNEIKSKRTQAA